MERPTLSGGSTRRRNVRIIPHPAPKAIGLRLARVSHTQRSRERIASLGVYEEGKRKKRVLEDGRGRGSSVIKTLRARLSFAVEGRLWGLASMKRTDFSLMLVCPAFAALCVWLSPAAGAGEVRVEGRTFALGDGFEIERVAGPPLVDRPIEADFDEEGRLYVSDSSGSNAPPKQQLLERTHRIVRLEDVDGDGRYDRRTVFADRMMFPEGVLWADGSLYVAAPPSIWKLTDTDDDGVADRREEWFQGRTLNGCANDLHGPYPGPDGWIYWCKGAFEPQSYERPDGPPFVTRAAHIFRRRLDGRGIVEPVMTGGMDNPVGIAFTPGGERIFSTTFLQHPGGGRRDGLIHAIYGGVYGKVHAVIDGHTRTGPDVMPVLTHLGPAAPAGLACYESGAFGEEFRGNLFAAQFNMQKVSRHVLEADGATFTTRDEDFLVGKDQDIVIKQDKRERVEGNSHLYVKGKRNQMIEGNQSLTVKGDRHELIGETHALSVAKELHIKAGTALVIEAEDLTLKGPGGFIRIDGSGVTIRGTKVYINSGGSPGEGAGASPEAPDEAKEAVVDDVSKTLIGQ